MPCDEDFYRLVETPLLLQHLTNFARPNGSATRMAVGNVDLQRRLKGSQRRIQTALVQMHIANVVQNLRPLARVAIIPPVERECRLIRSQRRIQTALLEKNACHAVARLGLAIHLLLRLMYRKHLAVSGQRRLYIVLLLVNLSNPR